MKFGVKVWAGVFAIVALALFGFLVISGGLFTSNLAFNSNISQTQTNTIKIGGMFSLSGTTAFAGQPEADFAKIAIDEINASGGINGKKIEYILEDDKCNAQDALTAAKKLIEEDGVKIILGPSCSPATTAVAPVSSSNKVIIFAASSLSTNIFRGVDYSFRANQPTLVPAQLQAEHALKSKNIKTVAIISELSNFPKSWTDDFEKEFVLGGGKVTKRFDFASGETDFKSDIAQIRSNKPDAVFVSTLGPAASILIIKQMNELGILDKVFLLGNHTSMDLEVSNGLDGVFPSNAFTVVPYSDDNGLLKKYVEKFHKEPTFEYFYTAAMYDAVYLLKDAITSCGENTKCIQDYLKSPFLNFKGTVMTWNFDKNGDPIIPKEDYKERRIENGMKKYYKIG
ncbi:MAG: ABC transporter substrate-binding protein [Candidatus Diapherotrites archaeon]|nr:ABC transporter substrate-binding protein [Candidatus Diapherotrites archaeon]